MTINETKKQKYTRNEKQENKQNRAERKHIKTYNEWK